MSAIADNDLRGKRVLFYINSQNFSRINSALKILQTIPGIVVRNSVFDRNDTLFNVQNCTIDLTTKTVRPHNKDDYITRISPVNYDPSADCPIFKNFLKEIFDGNINLISHEQRKLGYFLSGLTSEQKLFINFGSGCNGKSTLQEIFRSLMGDYAVNIPIEALMAKDMPGINNDIVRLRFARLATTGEVEIGKKLAESQTKLLTGGDVITARALYSEPIEFKNKAKIIMGTNHLPGVRGQEYGIFRRFDITPFNVTIPKEKIDRSLFNKLLKELPGILNWALDGFLEWQKYGLGEHEEIKQAVENYRISQDPIANFINECCVVGKSDYKIAAQELYKHYEEWCKTVTNLH
jgi:putative DNA primase/helicase